jgi:hypothetical protein
MVKLITVVTHSDGYLPWLEKSCKRFKIELIKLGYGQKWLGFSWRFKLIINYLKLIDPNELVIIIDAYDVILLRSLDDIEEYYNNIIKMTNKKIIMSEDKSIIKVREMIAKVYFDTCKDVRINAGLYLGKASYILDILSKINYNNEDDDQMLFTTYFNKNPEEIYIDSDNIFFLSRAIETDDILTDKNIKINNKKLTYMNSKPFFIHGNGNTYMHNLIIKLGYKISKKQIKYIINRYNEIILKKKIYYCNTTINKYKNLLNIILFILFILYIFYVCKKNIIFFKLAFFY